VKPVSRSFLYGIVDLGYVTPQKVAKITAQLLEGGVDILQLRAKERPKSEILQFAETMLPLTRAAQVPLILNDYPDLLRRVDAQGCHVGQEDFGIAEARDLAGHACIVGKSTHTLAQARQAEKEGADYIGFGPLFPTGTKPGAKPVGLAEIQKLHEEVQLPIYCIGGVKLENIVQVMRAGARRVCIVSDLLLAPDVASRTAEVKLALTKVSRAWKSHEGGKEV
jgi:thiamine-phosphate pyrophosphorylase